MAKSFLRGGGGEIPPENRSFYLSREAYPSKPLPLPRRLRHAFRIVDIDSNAESPLFINLKII